MDNEGRLAVDNVQAELQLDGASGNTFHLSGCFEKSGIDTRPSYICGDEFIDCGACGPQQAALTTASSPFFDFSGSYALNDMPTFYLDVQNLTEEETRNYCIDERFAHYYEQSSRRYEASVRVKFESRPRRFPHPPCKWESPVPEEGNLLRSTFD